MTLDQLRAKARTDLQERRPGVLLEWSWLVAEAEGKLAEARVHHDHLAHLQMQFRGSLLSSFPPSDERVERFEKYMVNDQMLAEAARWIGEAAAAKRACEETLRLLERPVKKVEPAAPLHVHVGGKDRAAG